MTAQQLLDYADLIGCPVKLNAAGQPTVGGKPNAALLGALKVNRNEIIRLLGGQECAKVDQETSEPDYCDRCSAWILEAEDTQAFCFDRRCEFRRRCRYAEGPF